MIVVFDDKKVKVDVKYDKIDKFFTFYSLNANKEKMAKLTFSIKDKKIWIYKIYTKKEFYRQGAGKALLFALENFASKNNIKYIEGKFYPENAFAKPFYEKLGYEIYKEGYETYVGKFLSKADSKYNIKNDNEIIF